MGECIEILNTRSEVAMLQKKKKGRISKRPKIEVLSELYEHMTAKQIAEQFKVSDSTVRHWISDYRNQIKEVNTDA